MSFSKRESDSVWIERRHGVWLATSGDRPPIIGRTLSEVMAGTMRHWRDEITIHDLVSAASLKAISELEDPEAAAQELDAWNA